MKVTEDGRSGENISRLHAKIQGRVQGVGFRAFTQRNAEILGLKGWVRNRWNGSVELVAEGPQANLDELVKILRRGPFSGTTRKVEVEWHQPSGEFTYFHIRRTG